MNADAPPINGHASSTEACLDAIERKLDRLLRVAEPVASVPGALAAAVDVFDEQADRAADRGVDLAARMRRLLALTEQLTDDRTLRLLESLAAVAPQAPGLAAMATDILDERVRALEATGIDLETSLTRGLHAALRFGAEVREREIEALQTLLRSPMLDRASVQMLSAGAEALVECLGRKRGRVGLVGLLRALRDPDIQRALDFLLDVARRFGHALRDGLPTAEGIHAHADTLGPARR